MLFTPKLTFLPENVHIWYKKRIKIMWVIAQKSIFLFAYFYNEYLNGTYCCKEHLKLDTYILSIHKIIKHFLCPESDYRLLNSWRDVSTCETSSGTSFTLQTVNWFLVWDWESVPYLCVCSFFDDINWHCPSGSG